MRIDCESFQEMLSEYLEGSLGKPEHVACSSHIMGCAGCHGLLNEVRETVEACRMLSAPAPELSALEARILERTSVESPMGCAEFEQHLTDYLDGFLQASLFHRWERHTRACEACSDLPGAVVRSISACHTARAEELPVSEDLHRRILEATLGSGHKGAEPSLWERLADRLRGLQIPGAVPRLASLTAVALCAFMFLVDGISVDGSVGGVYSKGIAMATETYRQGADVLNRETLLRNPRPESASPGEEAGGNGER